MFGEKDNLYIVVSIVTLRKKRNLIIYMKKIQAWICKWYLTWSVLGNVWIESRDIFFPIKTSYGFLLSEKCSAPSAINNRSDRLEIFFKTFGRPLVDKITGNGRHRKSVLWRCSCLPTGEFCAFRIRFWLRDTRMRLAVIVILVTKNDDVKVGRSL